LWWQWDGEEECGKVCKDGAEIHPRFDSTHPFFDGGDGRGGYEGQQIVVVGVHAIQFGIVDLLERVPCFVLLFGSKMFQGSGAWCFFLFFSSTTGSIPHGCTGSGKGSGVSGGAVVGGGKCSDGRTLFGGSSQAVVALLLVRVCGWGPGWGVRGNYIYRPLRASTQFSNKARPLMKSTTM